MKELPSNYVESNRMKESKEIERIDNLFTQVRIELVKHGYDSLEELVYKLEILVGKEFDKTKQLTEINETLRDQVKQWEKVPGLKQLREENEKLISDNYSANDRIKELGEELQSYKDKYDVVYINNPDEVEYVKSLNNYIKELEEGIKDVIPVLAFNKLFGSQKSLQSLLTKYTKNK